MRYQYIALYCKGKCRQATVVTLRVHFQSNTRTISVSCFTLPPIILRASVCASERVSLSPPSFLSQLKSHPRLPPRGEKTRWRMSKKSDGKSSLEVWTREIKQAKWNRTAREYCPENEQARLFQLTLLWSCTFCAHVQLFTLQASERRQCWRQKRKPLIVKQRDLFPLLLPHS